MPKIDLATVQNLKDTLIKFHEGGLFAFPTIIGKREGFTEKAPIGGKFAGEKHSGWKNLKKDDAINAPFQYPHLNAVGLATGAKSANLYCIDFDVKHDDRKDCFEVFKAKVAADMPLLWSKLYVETTISGGFHILYKVDEAAALEGNIKLSGRDLNEAEKVENKAAALYFLETRGEGGFVVTYPSEGYKVVQGDIFDLPVISEEEHLFLLDTAKSQHRASKVVFDKKKVYFEAKEANKASNSEKWEVLPIDDYNAKTDILELLKAYSWSEEKGGNANETRVKRPGAGSDSSGFVSAKDNVLVCFSHNAGLEVRGEAARVSPFSFLCQMQFGGDFKATIKHIIGEGFGKENEAHKVKIGKSKVNGSERMFVDIPDFEGLKGCATICFVPKGFDIDFCELNMGKVVIGEEFGDIAYTLKHRLKGVDYCFLIEENKHLHYDYEQYCAAVLALEIEPFFLEYAKNEVISKLNEDTGEYCTNWGRLFEAKRLNVVEFWLAQGLAAEKIAHIISQYPHAPTAEKWIGEYVNEKAEKSKLLANVRAAVAERERKDDLYVNTRGIKEDEWGTWGLKKMEDGKFSKTPMFQGHLNLAYLLPAKNDADKDFWVFHYHCLAKKEDLYFTLDNEKITIKAVRDRLRAKGKKIESLTQAQLDSLINAKIEYIETAKTIDFVGWDRENMFWAYADGLYCPYQKVFEPANEVGIVGLKHPKTGIMGHYYLPLCKPDSSDMLARYRLSQSDISWKEISRFYRDGWGDLGVLQLLFFMASTFKDCIAKKINPSAPCFAHFFVEGEAGGGKTTLLEMAKWFYFVGAEGVKVSLRTSATAASMNLFMTQMRNMPLLLDDYLRNENLDRTNGLLEAGFNEGGRKKLQGANHSQVAETNIYSTIVVSSNIPPTPIEGDDSKALEDRLLYARWLPKKRSAEIEDAFMAKLGEISEKGFGSAFLELLDMREVVEKEFSAAFLKAKNTLRGCIEYEKKSISRRQVDSWSVLMAIFDVCKKHGEKSGINLDYTHEEVLSSVRGGIVAQYERLHAEFDFVADFFDILSHNIVKHRLVEGEDYMIRENDNVYGEQCLAFKFKAAYTEYFKYKNYKGTAERTLSDALKNTRLCPIYDDRKHNKGTYSYRPSEKFGKQNTSVFVFPTRLLKDTFKFELHF